MEGTIIAIVEPFLRPRRRAGRINGSDPYSPHADGRATEGRTGQRFFHGEYRTISPYVFELLECVPSVLLRDVYI